MGLLARLFAPSESALQARQDALEARMRALGDEWVHAELILSRLKRDLSNQLKSLGQYEVRARRRAGEDEEPEEDESSLDATLRMLRERSG